MNDAHMEAQARRLLGYVHELRANPQHLAEVKRLFASLASNQTRPRSSDTKCMSSTP
jgi:hypothetical protein